MQQQKRQPILCNIIQYNEILYNTVQYHTIPCKIFTIITKTYWRLFANLCELSYSGKAFFHHPSSVSQEKWQTLGKLHQNKYLPTQLTQCRQKRSKRFLQRILGNIFLAVKYFLFNRVGS